MKWLRIALISIGVMVLMGFGGWVLYGMAYSQGEAVGYSDGYDQGNTVGQEAGYDLGQADGYHQGKQEGYDEGYPVGKADGYEEGVEAGIGHGYTIKDPTYKQVIEFLREDKTDKNEYVEDTYVCSHYARDVCNNAEAEVLRCAFVEIRYPDGGHSIIAFNTIDEGLVYFEPQNDWRVKPVVGKRYYECVEPELGYRYERPSFDDTIMDILVIW